MVCNMSFTNVIHDFPQCSDKRKWHLNFENCLFMTINLSHTDFLDSFPWAVGVYLLSLLIKAQGKTYQPQPSPLVFNSLPSDDNYSERLPSKYAMKLSSRTNEKTAPSIFPAS